MKKFFAIMKKNENFIRFPYETANEAVAHARSLLKEHPQYKLIILEAVGEIDAVVTTNYRNWVKKITEKV